MKSEVLKTGWSERTVTWIGRIWLFEMGTLGAEQDNGWLIVGNLNVNKILLKPQNSANLPNLKGKLALKSAFKSALKSAV